MEDDEQVVTPEGGLCTIRDCCVVICDDQPPQGNPGRGAFTDRDVITRAFDAVGKSVEKAYGLNNALRVTETLYALPIVYNARLTRAIGRAKFHTVMGIAQATVIELTGTVEIPADYMQRLLVHEGCHVAHCVLAGGGFAYDPPHGQLWQMLMVGAGEKPEAHCIDPRILMQSAELRAKRLGIERPATQLGPGDLRLGDTVSFQTKKHGRIVGRVESKTDRAVVLRDANGDRWRASYGLLTKEQAP
jgi:SprT-like family